MSHHHSHSEDLQAEHVPFPVPRPDDNSFPIWRLRRRKLIPLACIALFLFLLLFFAELWEPTDVKRLEATSPSFVINPTPTTLGTSTITSADNIYNQEEPVVFSLIIWSEQSAVEGALLIKVSPLAIW
jgi:tellurite resistance protein TehA-like permease